MSKPQIPVTNLRERIAALEQRNAGNGSRSASPSPIIGAGGGGGSGGALKEKIAKFEKKGGVPVPRGTFGLGAPPPPEARVQRNPELYGNRIPQPFRAVSANHTGNGGPPSRSGSSLGFHNSSMDYNDYRRSISMSSVITDLDDRPDYTPLTSPTFNFPDSPGSTVYTPETSPTIPGPEVQSTAPVPTKPPIQSRSTSFAKAVELAKKVAETGGVTEKAQEGGTPTPFVVNTAAIKREFEPPKRSVSSDKSNDALVTDKDDSDVQQPVVEESKPFSAEPTPLQQDEEKAPSSSLPPTPATAAAPVQIVVDSAETELATPTTLTAVTPTSPEPLTTPIVSTSTTTDIDVKPIDLVPEIPSKEQHLQPAGPISQTPQPAAEVASTPEDSVPVAQVTQPTELAPQPEVKKPASRNNKELSLNVEALKAQTSPPPNDVSRSTPEDTTPTTATYSHLLSPPPSAVPSVLSTSSGGSSMISPRPYSMVELSWAERVTPATSRGNVVFIPPSTASLPRKSDLIHYPPTPTEGETLTSEQSNGSAAKPATFSAVVHQKVREVDVPLPSAPSGFPQTPRKQKRMTMMPMPSPGQPELFSLLQSAVMLESTLEHGDLPTEVIKRKEEADREKKERLLADAIAADNARIEREQQKKLAFQNNPAPPPTAEEEELSKKAKLRHTFLIPLSKARSQHRKERSASAFDAYSSTGTVDGRRPKSPELPALPELLPSPDAEPVSPPTQDAAQPPPPPLAQRPKSAGVTKSRFSSFRRLGSVKSVIGSVSGGSVSRRSQSSDDTTTSSIPAIVKPDGSVAHGDVDEFGMARHGNGHHQEQSWPSLSPTKKGGSLSRASTFAEKMFSRSRTKSSGSTLSNMSGESTNSRTPSVYTLPPLPDSLSIIPPSPEYEERRPRRSISMKSLKSALKGRSSIDTTNTPPVPQIPSKAAHQPNSQSPPSVSSGNTSPTSTLGSPGPLKSPDYLGYNSLIPPTDDSRPTSWMSVSSLASTLPSPLFEKDIFDAFPAVPSSSAGQQQYTSLDQGLQSAALLTPSFDSAFLGSAIHLAGSHKSTIGTPITAASGLYSPQPPMSAAAASAGGSLQAPQQNIGSTRRHNKF